MKMLNRDRYWMRIAIQLANVAKKTGEIPVGAVLICNGKRIGSGYNKMISNSDPTAHAEIIALREGAININNYRLLGTTLYVTLEPCMMCFGAILNSRIERLVCGARNNSMKTIFDLFALYKKKKNL